MKKTSKLKNKLPGLLRKFYLEHSQNKQNEFSDWKEFDLQLKAFIMWLLQTNNPVLIDEIKQETLFALHLSLTSGSVFWDETAEESGRNDARIIEYLKAVIRSAALKYNEQIKPNYRNALLRAIFSICEELARQGFLRYLSSSNNGKKTRRTYYLYSSESEPASLIKISLPPAEFRTKEFIFWRGDYKISRPKLTQYLKYIFRELENFSLSPSYLAEVISLNSGYYTETSGYFETYNDDNEKDENETRQKKIVSPEKHNSMYPSPDNAVDESDVWLERFRNTNEIKNNKKLLHAAVFYLKVNKDLGIEDIADILGRQIKKSSIPNYFNNVINVLRIKDEYTSSDLQMVDKLLRFGKILNTMYNLEKIYFANEK